MSTEDPVRSFNIKSSAGEVTLTVITGEVVESRQSAYSATSVSGGGSNYSTGGIDPIRSAIHAWTTDTIFLRYGDREASFEIRNNTVPIRTGSRISAIFASRLGSENRVLAAIYNHDTRAKNVQYGVLGSGLGGVHPLQLSRAAKTMQTDVRSQAFVANAAGNVRNVGQMLAVMMVLCLSMLGIIAFWLAAIITHADVFATLTLICLATTIVSGAFLALTLVSSKFRETRIEFELRPHVSRLLDSMDNA